MTHSEENDLGKTNTKRTTVWVFPHNPYVGLDFTAVKTNAGLLKEHIPPNVDYFTFSCFRPHLKRGSYWYNQTHVLYIDQRITSSATSLIIDVKLALVIKNIVCVLPLHRSILNIEVLKMFSYLQINFSCL